MKTITLAASLAAMLCGLATSHAQAAPKHHKAAPVQAYQAEAAPEPVDQAAAAGYHRASGFEQVKAECELVANGLQPSPGFAIGSPEFVAGHAIGSAIGGMIAHAQNYEHCMTLKGYARQ